MIYAPFQTSDTSLPHGTVMPDRIMMSGYPATFAKDDITNALKTRLNISEIDAKEIGVSFCIYQILYLIKFAICAHYLLICGVIFFLSLIDYLFNSSVS